MNIFRKIINKVSNIFRKDATISEVVEFNPPVSNVPTKSLEYFTLECKAIFMEYYGNSNTSYPLYLLEQYIKEILTLTLELGMYSEYYRIISLWKTCQSLECIWHMALELFNIEYNIKYRNGAIRTGESINLDRMHKMIYMFLNRFSVKMDSVEYYTSLFVTIRGKYGIEYTFQNPNALEIYNLYNSLI